MSGRTNQELEKMREQKKVKEIARKPRFVSDAVREAGDMISKAILVHAKSVDKLTKVLENLDSTFTEIYTSNITTTLDPLSPADEIIETEAQPEESGV